MAKEVEKKKKEKKHFFKDFKAELKKVIWPTPKQVVNNTVAVITIVIITAVIVLVLDLAFEALNVYGVNKLRDLVANNNTVTENTTENDTEENVTEIDATEGEGSLEIDTTGEEDTSTQENDTVQE